MRGQRTQGRFQRFPAIGFENVTARASLEQRRIAMESVNAIAVPALTTIADESMPSSGNRADFLVIEAGLRDAVRAPGLAREPRSCRCL